MDVWLVNSGLRIDAEWVVEAVVEVVLLLCK